MCSPVNGAAFATTTALAAVTIASCFAAATAVTTVATVAYAILGITAGGASIASITAWLSDGNVSVSDYFSKFKEHAGVAIAGMYQLVAQTLVQALVAGLAEGISKAISRKISGPDVTVGHA